MSLRHDLDREAARLGFLACGVTSLEPSRYAEELDRWLAKGYAGTMRYLQRQAARRKLPGSIVPEALRVVVVLDNYAQPARDRPPMGARIAQYALGTDYHRDLAARLEQMADWLRSRGATVARSFTDAGPVPERELAARAGLGWIGKNTMLIRPRAGSLFFIGSVFTDLAFESDLPFQTDHCGSCTRCLDACPTNAFVGPRVLDATRCISYLTIELRADVPADLAAKLAGWAFGCDICNDVCPWNERFATPTSNPAYQDRGAIPPADPGFFDRLTEEEFTARFADTPLERPGLPRMRRNYHNAFRSLPS